MKNSLFTNSLICSVAATVLLAMGFHGAAKKLDPVAQKTDSATTVETGRVATLPCIEPVDSATKIL